MSYMDRFSEEEILLFIFLNKRDSAPARNFKSVPLKLINNMEDIVACLGLQVFNSDNCIMFSCSKHAQATFVENPQFSQS